MLILAFLDYLIEMEQRLSPESREPARALTFPGRDTVFKLVRKDQGDSTQFMTRRRPFHDHEVTSALSLWEETEPNRTSDMRWRKWQGASLFMGHLVADVGWNEWNAMLIRSARMGALLWSLV